VLERELGGPADRRTGGQVRPPSSSPPDRPTALPSSAEKAVVLLMLEGEPWKSRVAEAVDSEELEFPPYRAVFESVADDAVLALDDTSARAYEFAQAEGLGGRDPNEMYELAVNWLEARRLERQMERLDDQLPFETPIGRRPCLRRSVVCSTSSASVTRGTKSLRGGEVHPELEPLLALTGERSGGDGDR